MRIWPENRDAVLVFVTMSTQWHVGPAGRTGLIYSEVEPMCRRLEIGRERRRQVFFDLRHLEAGALEEMARRDED